MSASQNPRKRAALPAGLATALDEFQAVLDTAPVVGWPRKDAELAELARLVGKFPDEARKLLDDPS